MTVTINSRANDMIGILTMQRNAAADQAASIGAENIRLERHSKTLEEKNASLEKQVATLLAELEKMSAGGEPTGGPSTHEPPDPNANNIDCASH